MTPDDRDPTLDVRRDLTAIVELSALLADQAVTRAASKDMPGGLAMVALGPAHTARELDPRALDAEAKWLDKHGDEWCIQHETVKALCDHRLNPWADEDAWEPPLQTLLFWTEDQHDTAAANIESEAEWLIENIQWLYETEVHWDDFVKDIHAARMRLEAELKAGDRTEHAPVSCWLCGGPVDRLTLEDDERNTVRRECRCPPPPPHAPHGPCTCRRVLTITVEPDPSPLDPEAKRVIARTTAEPEPHHHQRRGLCCLRCRWDARHSGHDQGGLRDQWLCRACHNVFDVDEYRQAVAKDARDNATALPAAMLAERFDVTVGQIRVWANRGFVRKRGRDEYGRMLYDVADVETRLCGGVLA